MIYLTTRVNEIVQPFYCIKLGYVGVEKVHNLLVLVGLVVSPFPKITKIKIIVIKK